MLRWLHHIGTFLLFAATVFLIITSISAPVVNNIGLLRVNLPDNTAGSEILYGTFGWCVQDFRGDGKDSCTKSKVGYNPQAALNKVNGPELSDHAEKTTKVLTRVMILHPIAAGLSFIAFILAFGAGVIGSFLASLVSGITFIVTVVALICDFVGFGIVRVKVNDQDISGMDAHYSVGTWCILVAAICNFLATIIVFITCCSGRVKKRREQGKMESHHISPRRRRFWQR